MTQKQEGYSDLPESFLQSDLPETRAQQLPYEGPQFVQTKKILASAPHDYEVKQNVSVHEDLASERSGRQRIYGLIRRFLW